MGRRDQALINFGLLSGYPSYVSLNEHHAVTYTENRQSAVCAGTKAQRN